MAPQSAALSDSLALFHSYLIQTQLLAPNLTPPPTQFHYFLTQVLGFMFPAPCEGLVTKCWIPRSQTAITLGIGWGNYGVLLAKI